MKHISKNKQKLIQRKNRLEENFTKYKEDFIKAGNQAPLKEHER